MTVHTEQMSKQTTFRPLHEIAREIRADFKPMYFGAVPYVDAMGSMDKITDNYGADSGHSIVAYALSNLKTWRGDKAREIKAELNKMLKA
jgi:hypothetical protein